MAHHIPTQIELYSLWSMNRMRAPPATTTMAVAATITPIAPRTDGGSRRNRFSLRSTRFGLGMSLPPLVLILTTPRPGECPRSPPAPGGYALRLPGHRLATVSRERIVPLRGAPNLVAVSDGV